MAIYQRDRNFHELFADIDVDIIPLKFIRDVTCFLDDGTKIVLSENDFVDSEANGGDLESLVRDLKFYDHLTDLSIRINYDKVEKDVGTEVEKILNSRKK